MHALKSEAMRNIRYEDMADNYKVVWLMNDLKLMFVGVDSHINKFYSAFHTLKVFYMIRQNTGETVTKYSDHFFNQNKLMRNYPK